MPSIPLPERPHLDKLRAEAKRLVRDTRGLTLAAAQLTVARRYGFASWPRLKQHVELINQLTWQPDEPTGAEPAADAFVRLACLNYDHDDPERRRRAADMLATDRDGIVGANIWAAAAATDAEAVDRYLVRDPAAARRRGGPYRWTPLFYLAYSRVDPQVAAGPVLRIAGRLLDAGADPNEGYLWRGRPTPFTLLTGAFGEGEQGPAAQPRHPHSMALAERLLAAGADPNDAQALYNRMFGTDNDHLEVLLRYGLGRGDGGPWKARLGDAATDPAELVRGQLAWAVTHDQRDRIALLIESGVDVRAPFGDGRTPADLAALQGNRAVLAMLTAAGSGEPALDPVEDFLGRVMGGLPLDGSDPAEARRTRPGFLVWAAACGRIDAVRTLLDCGFDIDARGRSDTPGDTQWETALHAAVAAGRIDIVELLLDRGADPTIRDARFDATPQGWAAHFNRPDIAARLQC